jgi:hypothetical protein
MDPVKKTYGWTLALVALVFALGVVAGVLGARAVQHRRLREAITGDPAFTRTRLLLLALDARLGLTSEQRRETERLLRAQEDAYRAALGPCRPEVKSLREALAAELEPSLTPTQRATLDQLFQRAEREW